MARLTNAFLNSSRAFMRLLRTESAFQQEIILLVLAIPVAWFVATSWPGFALLIAAILLLILVEVINTASEAAFNAVSRDFHIDIQLAKDCGSLAVLIAILIAGGIWTIAIVERLFGLMS